jgi:hypothetical protein
MKKIDTVWHQNYIVVCRRNEQGIKKDGGSRAEDLFVN